MGLCKFPVNKALQIIQCQMDHFLLEYLLLHYTSLPPSSVLALYHTVLWFSEENLGSHCEKGKPDYPPLPIVPGNTLNYSFSLVSKTFLPSEE